MRHPTRKSARKSPSLRRLAKRQRKICHYCGCHCDGDGDRQPTRDHAKPTSQGGTSVRWNLVLACFGCNQLKARRGYEEFLLSEDYARLVKHNRAPALQRLRELQAP